MAGPRSGRLRDRRGRGLRSPLLPQAVPAWRSRSDEFDAVALEAFADIDADWHDRLSGLDIAVDDIPRLLPRDPETVQWPDEVTADGAVPLARLIPAGVDVHGQPTRAQIILFRRPLESRATRGPELLDLVHEVLVQQVATHLGVDEDTIDNGPD
ncbi:metallopeptidase family protein [Gordonia sinesedis]